MNITMSQAINTKQFSIRISNIVVKFNTQTYYYAYSTHNKHAPGSNVSNWYEWVKSSPGFLALDYLVSEQIGQQVGAEWE